MLNEWMNQSINHFTIKLGDVQNDAKYIVSVFLVRPDSAEGLLLSSGTPQD